MKNKFRFCVLTSVLLAISCLEEDPIQNETLHLASVQGSYQSVPHIPLTVILTEDESIVFSSLVDYPKIREALLDMYDNLFLPEDRFSYFFEKLHKEDPSGLLSSLAIQNQFFLTNSENLREKYALLLLMGNICGENSVEFLYNIATTPLPTSLDIEDERLEWEELIRVAAARNIYRIYKFRKNNNAQNAMVSILGSNSNISNGVRLELISHLKAIEGLNNQDLSVLINIDFIHLLNIEIMQEIPNEVIEDDPVKIDPINNDVPYMEGE